LDLVSLGVLVVMILAGGLVAFIADKLGRTLGKKRLTLFGLRPRHTATMITVFAGMVIPFVTVLLIAIVSKEARDWIVEGRQAQAQRDQYRRENNILIDQQRDLIANNGGLKKENESEERKLKETERQRAELEKRLAQETKQVTQLNREAKVLASQIKGLSSSLQLTQDELQNSKANLKSAELARQKKQEQLSQVERSYFQLKKDADDLNTQNFKLQSDADKLTVTNKDLSDKNDKARLELVSNKAELERVRLTLDEARTDLNILISQRDLAISQRDIAGNYLDASFKGSRFTPIIFGIGDELARVSVPAGASEEDAKGLLNNLLKQAVAVAKSKGAQPDVTLGEDAADLFPKPVPGTDKISVLDQENAIAKSIANSKDSFVLVATSFANTFQGEWVPLVVKTAPNPMVYKKNDKVAETMINGSESEEQIIQRISDFLTSSVKTKAIKDGMIPVDGQSEALGSIPLFDIVALARSIKETARPIRLAALVNNDTRAGDPLQLHFRVR
jgi:uncharacterized protein (DUF3084 family)